MGIWKDKTSGKWIYSFQHLGKKYGARGYPTKAAARAAREQRRVEITSAKPTRPGTDFKYVASLYLDYAERRFAKKTYEYKKYVVKQFIEYHGDIDIADINPQHLHDYLNTRHSNHNYNAHRKDLCAMFTFAIRRLRLIDHNPCWDLEKMPHTPCDKVIPTENQILQLIVAADPKTDERDLLLTVLHTLARIDEILRLTWQDVNFENKTVTLWTRKRKDGAYEPDGMPINDDLFEILQRRWNRREQNKWVFFNSKTNDRYYNRSRMMRALCRRAKIDPPIGFHAIRHFMATYLVDKGKQSKHTISGLLRHKSLQTTEIYLHSVAQSKIDAMASVAGTFSVAPGVALCTQKHATEHQTAQNKPAKTLDLHDKKSA